MKLYKVTQESLLSNIGGKMWNHPHGPSGVVDKILKRLYFMLYVEIINMAAFSSLDSSITSPTVPAYINSVAMMRVLVDHHCLQS